MTQQKINVGLIGAGANSELHHIPKLQAIEGVEITAVANRTLESAQKIAEKYKIKKASGNWRELIEDSSIDAIVIGTWPYLHKSITIAALQAGKHVLTEARMAMDAKEAKEMLQLSQQHPELVAMVVPAPITFEYDATISNIIKAGSLGNLVYVEVKSIGGFSKSADFAEKPGSPLTWRQNRELSGLNIGTLGIFYECLQRWIGDVSTVQALGKTVVNLRKDHASLELKAVHIPDHLDVLATHPSGANIHFTISTVLGIYHGFRSGFALYGTEGTLVLDLDKKKLTIAAKEEGRDTDAEIIKDVHVAEERKGSWRVEEEFVGAIRGTGEVRRTDFASGARYMEFTEAVHRAMQTGAVVHLPLLNL